jgi:hypothetical protein
VIDKVGAFTMTFFVALLYHMMALILASKADTLAKPALVTPWTAVHVLTGTAFYTVGVHGLRMSVLSAACALFVVHALYEAKDYYFAYVATKGRKENSLPNSIADQVAAMLGFAIAASLSMTWPMLFGATVVVFVSLSLPGMGRSGSVALSPSQLWNERG